MGTSQSSSGPGPGVPLVPPWVDEIALPTAPDGTTPSENQDEAKKPELTAPRARFGAARSALGGFVVPAATAIYAGR